MQWFHFLPSVFSLHVYYVYLNNLFVYILAALDLRSCVWLSLAAESRGCSPVGLCSPLQRLLLLQSTGSRACGLPCLWGTGLSCTKTCWVFLARGLNPCFLRWPAGSQSLGHQGSPCPVHLQPPYTAPPCSRETKKKNKLQVPCRRCCWSHSQMPSTRPWTHTLGTGNVGG